MSIIDSDLLEALARPTESSTGLPNGAYTDAEFLSAENESLFRNTWVFAGFAHELASAGDVHPCTVAGQPVFLVRDSNKHVRAFNNVCSHRGAQLVVEKRSGVNNIVCPNHSWTYSLEGQLRVRPHFFGGEKHERIADECHEASLEPLRCAVWHDWIFVNVSGDAEDFESYINPITQRLGDYVLGHVQHAKTMSFELAANWKLPVENFIEPYHVFSCHPWLNSFVSMEERLPPEFDRHVLYCGYDFKTTDPARGEGLPYFPGLSERSKHRGDWYVLFPNFCFEIFPDQVAVLVSEPTGAETCRETLALYFVGDGATSDDYSEARERVYRNWEDLNREDIGVIERMQAGRQSKAYTGGHLSPYWDPVLQHFARLVANAVIEL